MIASRTDPRTGRVSHPLPYYIIYGTANERPRPLSSERQTPNSKFQASNSKLRASNSKRQASNSKLRASNSKRQASNSKLRASNSKHEAVPFSASVEEGTDRKEPWWAWPLAFNPSATTTARVVFACIFLSSRSCELSSLQNIFQGRFHWMAATAGEKEPRRAVLSPTKRWEGLNLAGIPLLKTLQVLWKIHQLGTTAAIILHRPKVSRNYHILWMEHRSIPVKNLCFLNQNQSVCRETWEIEINVIYWE